MSGGLGSTSREARSAPSIRRRLGALLASLGVLVAGLLVVATLQLRASGVQARAENQRNTSFRLADGMRQSSNDLTQMVRLYVSTGDSRYRAYYKEILAIRSGTAPRPTTYDSSFWQRVLAEGKGFASYGEPRSLVQEMQAARFTDSEFNALNASLRASDNLAQLELEVMARVAQRILGGVDGTYFSDIAPEYRRLVDSAYLVEKGMIMRAIDDFVAQVEARTLDAVERAQSTSRTLSLVQIGILGAILLVAVVAMARATKVLLRPLGELASSFSPCSTRSSGTGTSRAWRWRASSWSSSSCSSATTSCSRRWRRGVPRVSGGPVCEW